MYFSSIFGVVKVVVVMNKNTCSQNIASLMIENQLSDHTSMLGHVGLKTFQWWLIQSRSLKYDMLAVNLTVWKHVKHGVLKWNLS